MFGCSRETLPAVWEWWEALLDIRQWSGGPPECAGGPLGCLGVVGWPSRKFESGREALLDV